MFDFIFFFCFFFSDFLFSLNFRAPPKRCFKCSLIGNGFVKGLLKITPLANFAKAGKKFASGQRMEAKQVMSGSVLMRFVIEIIIILCVFGNCDFFSFFKLLLLLFRVGIAHMYQMIVDTCQAEIATALKVPLPLSFPFSLFLPFFFFQKGDYCFSSFPHCLLLPSWKR